MSPKILTIHGFENKPPVERLRADWSAAIAEGIRRNLPGADAFTAGDLPLDMVYWADVLFGDPLSEEVEPYVPYDGEGPLLEYEEGVAMRFVNDIFELGGRVMDWAMWSRGVHEGFRWLTEEICDQCERYIRRDTVRQIIFDRIMSALEAQHGHRLMVVGHSMGSVIIYDVLCRLERHHPERAEGLEVELLTTGSPLGFPYVHNQVMRWHQADSNPVPECVVRWQNFSDRLDPATLDVRLCDDFTPNRRGVLPEDDLVCNLYVRPNGKRFPHKSYGYLRTPEVSRAIWSFLQQDSAAGD